MRTQDWHALRLAAGRQCGERAGGTAPARRRRPGTGRCARGSSGSAPQCARSRLAGRPPWSPLLHTERRGRGGAGPLAGLPATSGAPAAIQAGWRRACPRSASSEALCPPAVPGAPSRPQAPCRPLLRSMQWPSSRRSLCKCAQHAQVAVAAAYKPHASKPAAAAICPFCSLHCMLYHSFSSTVIIPSALQWLVARCGLPPHGRGGLARQRKTN